MYSLAAKTLDWLVIQLARRCVRNDRGVPERSDAPLSAELALTADIASPSDACWSEGGGNSFRFASLVQTAAEESNTVHGRFFPAAADWRKRPTAVLLHGWNAELCYRKMFPDLAVRFHRQGVNAVAIELPYHMQRRPCSGPVTDFISSDLERMLEATRQAIADIRALCRWFESQGCSEIGLWGFSLGAWLAGLTARVEPSLRFLVLTTPIARIDQVIRDLPFCAPIRRALEKRQVNLSEIDLGAVAPAMARERVLLVEGRHDLFARAITVEELWRAWGQPEIWRLPHGHISVLLSKSGLQDQVDWIAEKCR